MKNSKKKSLKSRLFGTEGEGGTRERENAFANVLQSNGGGKKNPC